VSDLKVEAVTFEKDGVLYHVENALMGKAVKLRKSRFGNIHYNCPHCRGKNEFGMDEIYLTFNDISGDKLYPVQQYAKVSSDLRGLEETRDFISYLVKRAECRKKHLEASKHVRQRAGITLRLKCIRCETETTFNVVAEAKVKAPIPIDWTVSEGELASERAAEDLGEKYELSDMDRPDVLQRLMGAKELLDALETRPIVWRGHEKIMWLIEWDRRDEKSVPECAEEFMRRIEDLRSDIEKAPMIIKGFVDNAEKQLLNNFKTTAPRHIYSEFVSVLCSEDGFENVLLRRLRRQLAENLLWLQDEINKLVMTGKLDAGSSQ